MFKYVYTKKCSEKYFIWPLYLLVEKNLRLNSGHWVGKGWEPQV